MSTPSPFHAEIDDGSRGGDHLVTAAVCCRHRPEHGVRDVQFLDFVAERISSLFDLVTSLNLPLRFVSKRRSGLSHPFARRRQPPHAIEQVRGFVLRRPQVASFSRASAICGLNLCRAFTSRGLVLARVVNPGKVSYPRLPSAKRAKQRAELRAAYLLGLEKNRQLGVDPVYRGVCDRDSPHHKQWLKQSKAWDIAHQPKPEAVAA